MGKVKEGCTVGVNTVKDISELILESKDKKTLKEIKKDLRYYLDTNEEKGVVYIPKFVVEKIVNSL